MFLSLVFDDALALQHLLTAFLHSKKLTCTDV